jgi:hypothetical protein
MKQGETTLRLLKVLLPTFDIGTVKEIEALAQQEQEDRWNERKRDRELEDRREAAFNKAMEEPLDDTDQHDTH